MINFFKIYDDAVSHDFCDEVISFFEENNHLSEDGVVSGTKKSQKKIKKVVKNTSEIDLSFLLSNRNLIESSKVKAIEEKINNYSIKYTNEYIYGDNYIDIDSNPKWDSVFEYLKSRDPLFSNKNIKISNFLPDIKKITTSGYRIKKYKKGTGYYNYHADPAWSEVWVDENRWRVMPGKYLSNIRLLSVIIYFNTVNAGGETSFPFIPVSIKPVKGRVAIFPTHWTYLHKAEVPLSCDKYSMNTFVSIVL